MKKILLFVLFIVSTHCFAQDTAYYKASNGVTYKVYDSVKLGRGVGNDGDFMFIQGGFPGGLNRVYNNSSLTIREIQAYKAGNTLKMLFIVKEKGIKYNIDIEDAIDACEVVPCNPIQNSTGSVADELMKLKKLLDAGALSREEFDGQKKKLLGN